MSKKNIIKLNKQYFSCNPINENFEDLENVPVINAETEQTEPITINDNVSLESTNSEDNNSPPLRIATNDMESPKKKTKKRSKRRSRRRSRRRSKRRSKKRSKRRSKRRSRKGSKKGSRKGSRKGSKKGSKKRKEGFCAGNTCITESDLKNIINLLKNLELKK